MKTITITLTDKQYEKYAERAKASGKTVEQYLSDRINGVPFGYTVAGDGLLLHQPEADRIKAFVDEYTYEAVREKLERGGLAKSDNRMTVEDIREYAIEKRMPRRAVDDMVQRLSAEYPGGIDDVMACLLLTEIDRSAEYWEGVRSFLDWSKGEREKRRRERKNK